MERRGHSLAFQSFPIAWKLNPASWRPTWRVYLDSLRDVGALSRAFLQAPLLQGPPPFSRPEPSSEIVRSEMVTYDSVTIHFKGENEDPVTIDRVTDLVESRFPGSGERALQVIDDPAKDLSLGLLETKVILFRPEEIDRLVLRAGKEEVTATVEEVIG